MRASEVIEQLEEIKETEVNAKRIEALNYAISVIESILHDND